jgi:hypothetical protein
MPVSVATKAATLLCWVSAWALPEHRPSELAQVASATRASSSSSVTGRTGTGHDSSHGQLLDGHGYLRDPVVWSRKPNTTSSGSQPAPRVHDSTHTGGYNRSRGSTLTTDEAAKLALHKPHMDKVAMSQAEPRDVSLKGSNGIQAQGRRQETEPTNLDSEQELVSVEPTYGEEEAFVVDDDDNEEEDVPSEPKEEMEAELWVELDVDDDRDEPVLKAVVLLLAVVMLYAGWRNHCQQRKHHGTQSISNWAQHTPLPVTDVDEDWRLTEESSGKGPQHHNGSICANQALHDHSTRYGRKQRTGGWSFDIFSMAADRLAL